MLGVYHLYVADSDEAAHAIARKHWEQYWGFFAALDQKGSWGTTDYKEYKGGLSRLFGDATL